VVMVLSLLTPMGPVFAADGGGLGAMATGQPAASPSFTYSPSDSTYSEQATGRFYVRADSIDDGYLSYEWHRSAAYDAPQDKTASAAAIKATAQEFTTDNADASLKADGTKSVLDFTTSSVDATAYYYYWATVTNHVDSNGDGDTNDSGETNYLDSGLAEAKVVDRAMKLSAEMYDSYQYLYPELQNGDFSALNTNDNYSINVVPNASGFPSFGWQTTHYATLSGYTPRCIEIRGNGRAESNNGGNSNEDIGYTSYGFDPNRDELKSYQHGAYAELSAAAYSSIFQEIATIPGKIYEWSLDHITRPPNGNDRPDVMAVVIGASLNSAEDYGSTTSYYNKYNASTNIDSQGTFNSKALTAPENGGPYVYGVNQYTYFQTIVNQVMSENGITAGSYTDTDTTHYFSRNFNSVPQVYSTKYNDKTYYVSLSSATKDFSNNESGSRWRHRSGSYTVPAGQGTSVFAFVNIYSTSA
jgi:hypothetical protein